MRQLSESSIKVTSKTFSRKHIALGRIINDWESIIGKKLSLKAQPCRLHYRKFKKTKKPYAILEIAISASDATLMHYQKDLILQRINQIFGDSWIQDIRFTNHQSHLITKKTKPKKRIAPIEINPEQEQELQSSLQNMDDHNIKSALHRLGTAIMGGHISDQNQA